jgi:hypothetical protein
MSSQDNKWKYYNYALIPNIAPDEDVVLISFENNELWKKHKKAFLARWTTEYDCGYETEWWYCIKDTKLDLSTLNSKRRYEITKGNKNFYCKEINPKEYYNELLDVQSDAYLGYQKLYRPVINKKEFDKYINNISKNMVFGVFYRELNKLCGYAVVAKNGKCINYMIHKTIPEYEKYGVNAALCFYTFEQFDEYVQNDKYYICDGERSVSHITSFQDYLEKYFNFRKVYCKLNIKYRPGVKWVINLLYIFRNVLKKVKNIKIIHQINAVLAMEEIVRRQKEK